MREGIEYGYDFTRCDHRGLMGGYLVYALVHPERF